MADCIPPVAKSSPCLGVERWPREDLEAALIGVAGQDHEAFCRLHKATKGKILQTCFETCANRAMADDIASEVYATVWQKASQWDRSRGSAITWLCAIARNKAIDWQRAQRPNRSAELREVANLPDGKPCAATTIQHYQEIALAVRALATLPDHQRFAITAAFFEGRSYPSLACQLGVPLSTIKSRIRRGLAELRRQMTDD